MDHLHLLKIILVVLNCSQISNCQIWSNPLGVVKNVGGEVTGTVVGVPTKAGKEAVGGVSRPINNLQQTTSQFVAGGLIDVFQLEAREIKYYLYNQNHPKSGQLMPKDGTINGTDYDKDECTKLIIHGFAIDGSPLLAAVGARKTVTQNLVGQLTIKNHYIKALSKCNLILMDWTSITRTIQYPTAAAGVITAGKKAAEFLYSLQKNGNLVANKTHIIGFSLGGHASGIAGRIFKEQSGQKLGRITGLDPAGPLFDLFLDKLVGSSDGPEDVKYILDEGDANFVDNIHCNMQIFGTIAKMGHADFYPNGGRSQPRCEALTDDIASCSHSRCWALFASSIVNFDAFPACDCESWESFVADKCKCNGTQNEVAMGDSCPPTAHGSFYLRADLKIVDIPKFENSTELISGEKLPEGN